MPRHTAKPTQAHPRNARGATTPGQAPVTSQRLLPLGALAAGFGLLNSGAWAQTAPEAPAPAASAASAPAARPETTMQPISVKAKAESDATSLRAATTGVAKGSQDIMDVPQAVTIITERLMNDRQVDTLNEALHLMGGISFLAAEGGEQDIRLRGFSISGDIYADTIHDPGFYDRDVFGFERIELLRGSASMLFGRGSTGGVVNQVSKQAFLDDANIINITAGNDGFLRFVGDFNYQTGETSAIRVNLMRNTADNNGNFIDKEGAAVNYRWGIGTDDEFVAGLYYLHNNNGMNYGLPWARVSSAQETSNPSVMIPGLNPSNVYYGAPSDYNAGGASYGTLSWLHRFNDGGALRSTFRYGTYDRDQRASTIRFCQQSTNSSGMVNNPDCPTTPQGLDTISDATLLNRGTNNKVQDMNSGYLQFDYTNRFNWFGTSNEVLAGLDLANEDFSGFAMITPPGVTLDKNSPRTTLGTPDNGYGWVDESLRIKRQQAAFEARAVGVFAQDLIQVADFWKVLVGLRYDYFKGDYQTYQTADGGEVAPGTLTADRGRSDGEWSERFGVLYQPTQAMTYYFSYGTSFNTSGDTYAYDLPGSNTPPESSRNIELGAKLDLFNNLLSTRFSIFNITKFHERNRDSPERHTDRRLPAVGATPCHRHRHRHRRAHHAKSGHVRVLHLDSRRRDRCRQPRWFRHLGRTGGPAPVAHTAQQRLGVDDLPGAAATAARRRNHRTQLADAQPEPTRRRRPQLRHRRCDGRVQLQRPYRIHVQRHQRHQHLLRRQFVHGPLHRRRTAHDHGHADHAVLKAPCWSTSNRF